MHAVSMQPCKDACTPEQRTGSLHVTQLQSCQSWLPLRCLLTWHLVARSRQHKFLVLSS